MKRRRTIQTAIVTMVSILGLLFSGGVARADVIVPPGGGGNVCSPYQFIVRSPNQNVYWQVCAWADNEVWFTIHLGNSGNTSFHVDHVDLGFVRSGVPDLCSETTFPFGSASVVIPARSVIRSANAFCDFPRTRAAYQARGMVNDAVLPRPQDKYSDTLQVQ